eukprot:c9244_g1_i1.p1 GENE.c9244_g1_i1~~c9244_g1_i1.p1  ORF type:complete len:169 (-),score=32.35 c9244_g1_i1:578-1084(-)
MKMRGLGPTRPQLKLKHHKRDLWLFKIPTYLMNSWTTYGSSKVELGILTQTLNPDGTTTMSFQANSSLAPEAPKAFSLDSTPQENCQNIEIFSHENLQTPGSSGVPTSFALEGAVSKRFDIRAQAGMSYDELNKRRMEVEKHKASISTQMPKQDAVRFVLTQCTHNKT